MALKRSSYFAVVAAGLASLALLAGCPGSLDPDEFGGEGTSSCGAETPSLLAKRCASEGCHSGAAPAGNLDLLSPGVQSRVVGKQSQCGVPLANPSNPDESGILKKVTGNTCGLRMPLGQAALSSDEVDCLRTWIANGAK